MGSEHSDGSGDDLVWESMLVGRSPGASYSTSRKVADAFSPLTRDGDNELGHVVMRYPDDESYLAFDDSDLDSSRTEAGENLAESAGEALGALVVLAGVVGVAAAAPRIRRWWSRRRGRDDASDRLEEFEFRDSPVAHHPPPLPAAQVETLAVEPAERDAAAVAMTRDEAQERLIAALEARRFSDQQIRMLQRARIYDDGFAALTSDSAGAQARGPIGPAPLELEAERLSPDELMLLQFGQAAGGDGNTDDRQTVGWATTAPVNSERPLRAGECRQPMASARGLDAPDAAAVPPGWYEDPWRISRVRYWNGHAWTHHVG